MSNPKPNHSFVVLAFQESPYLEYCLQSIQKQSHPSIRYISTSTPNHHISGLARKYKFKLHVHHQKGISADWSQAYKIAPSPYVTLAHQDDIYHPDYTKSLLSAAQKHPDSLILFSNYNEVRLTPSLKSPNLIFKELSIKIFLKGKSSTSSSAQKKLLVSFGNPICCPSVMYHKKLIGKFVFNPDLSVNLDWDAWFKLSSRKGSFTYVNKILVSHRIHPKTETSKALTDNRRQNEDKFMFHYLWPSPIANLITQVYRLTYLSN